MNQGIHHIGLATHDMERTLEFYEEVLGFPAVVCEMIEMKGGGTVRHAFFDAGGGELLAFMELNDVEGVSSDFDAGINRGLGLPEGMIHFAFEAGSPEALRAKRQELADKGVEITDVVNHDGWCESIYFKDPNPLQLEFCCLTQELGEQHIAGRFSEEWTRWEK